MLHLAVCEDCEAQNYFILEMVALYKAKRGNIQLETTSFLSGEKLLESLEQGNKFDLMLLDIVMPGLNGIELAKEIRKKDENVILIYISASEDFAIDAFKVYASNYIVKPVIEENLFPILDRLIPLSKKTAEQYFTFSTTERTVRIPFSSIASVELLNRKPCVCLEDGSVLTGKFLRGNFNELIKPLFNDERFFHSHKSYVVNISHAVELTNHMFVMKNHAFVPIAKRNYAEAKSRYLNYHQKIS